MIVYIPLIVCIIGLLIYALATHAKVAELGRLAYFAGLFVTLLSFAGKVIGKL